MKQHLIPNSQELKPYSWSLSGGVKPELEFLKSLWGLGTEEE